MSKVSRRCGVLKHALPWVAVALSAGGAAAQASDPRAAQAEFERERVARLPWSRERASGPCDEVVGRFCYRHVAPSDRPPPAEPAEIGALRERLLAILDAAASAEPADGWVAGQRVRYRIEAGRSRDAVEAAAECAAEAWWCSALRGLALHASGEFAAAERAFDAALDAMPAEERARWTDLEPLLDARARSLWRTLDAGARAAFARRTWWAGDPLWSVPGNELRTEHLARRTLDLVQADAASAYGVGWGADLEELLVRYGWPVAWERVREGTGRLGSGGAPAIVAHDPPGARRFVPSLVAIADPAVAAAADWALEDPAPRATYAPGYARRFLPMEPQIAAFRRPAGAILAVGWSLPPDSVERGSTIAAEVLASEGPDRPFAVARASSIAPEGALALEVPWPRAVVGVEALGGGAAGRWREGLDLPVGLPVGGGLPALSDLLLLAPGGGPLPADLEAAIPRTRPEATARAGEELPVFWEVYPRPGSSPGPVTIALALRPGPEGLGARVARALGLRRGSSGAEIRWSEIVSLDPVVPRAVALSLPDLGAGRWVLELEVRWPDGTVRRASRLVRVDDGSS